MKKNYRLWYWIALMVAAAILMKSDIVDRDWPSVLLGLSAVLVLIREYSSRKTIRKGLTYAAVIMCCISIAGRWLIR